MTLPRKSAIRRPDVPRTDVLIAAGLFAIILAESRIPGRFPGPLALWLATALAQTVPLAWRRSRPLVAMILGGVAIDVQATVAGVPQSAGMFLSSVVFTYSTAAHGSWRARAWGIGIMAVVLPVYLSQDPATASLATASPTVAIQIAAWAAGASVRRRHDRAELAERVARESSVATVRAAAEERIRIAHELHDVVAHGLSVMVVQAATARLAWERGDARAGEALLAVEAAGRAALGEMRRLLQVLQPDGAPLDVVEPVPGLADMPALLERLRPTGMEISYDEDPSVRAVLSPGMEITLYRIAQEALTNVVKHAGATTVSVSLRHDADDVVLRVENDAPRRHVSRPRLESGGRGLLGMRERALAFGGSVEAGARGRGGYAVVATLPVPVPS